MQLHHTEKHSNDIITIHEEPPTMISCARFKRSKLFSTLQLTNNSIFHFYSKFCYMCFACMHVDEDKRSTILLFSSALHA